MKASILICMIVGSCSLNAYAESQTMLLDREFCRLVPPGTGGAKNLPKDVLQFKGEIKELNAETAYCYIEIPKDKFYAHFQFCAVSESNFYDKSVLPRGNVNCAVKFYGGNSVAFDSSWPKNWAFSRSSCSFSCLTAK